MNILIIGNLGYLGSVLSRHMRAVFPDAIIEGFDTGYFAHLVAAPSALPEVVLNVQHFGDVRQFPVELMEGRDAVVYLAAMSNNSMGCEYEAVTMDVNCNACLAIARIARDCGVATFTLASSCALYHSVGREDLLNEDAALTPLSTYTRSKMEAEEGLAALAEKGFLVSCLRFATACGFSTRLRLDLVLNDFVASALTTGHIEILSDGKQWRPLIHVKDMALAIEWSIARTYVTGGSFLVVNVGSNSWNYRILELAEAVKEELEGVKVVMTPETSLEEHSYRVDFSRFSEMAPDHTPKVSLPDAVADLIRGLQAMHFTEKRFRDSTLVRIKVLQAHKDAGRLDAQLKWDMGRLND